MSIMNFRGFRFIGAFVLVMFLTAACSGPESGDDRTPTVENSAGAPTATASTEAEPVVTEPGQPTEPPDVEVPAPESSPEPTMPSAGQEPDATVPPEVEASPTLEAPAPTETLEPTPTVEPTATPVIELEGAVLPEHRIIAYYGHPSTGNMGILGEYSKEDLYQVLMDQVAEYEAADPNTPVIPAFELIATVAQPDPQSDGTYLLYTGDPWIQEYVDFTAENDMLLFLDLQIGHSTIRDQLAMVWHWMQYPHVHVAFDPEFATGPTHPPGTIIGGVDGNHVNIAIEMLSELVLDTGLPPKIIILHQFDTIMIDNKMDIQPLPGVDFVLHMDGWGTTEAKVSNYHHFVRDQLIQYGGFKIFYKQDIPVMTAEEVLQMDPPPLFISYQ